MRVRWLVVLGLALSAPTAGALAPAVSVPGPVPADGTPLQARVAVGELPDAPVEVKAWVGGEGWQASRTWNGSSFQRSDHYAWRVGADEARWARWLSLRVNPDSANHDRLLKAGEAVVGVRARGPDGTATARTRAALMDAVEHRPAAAGPGEARVAWSEDAAAIARRVQHAPERGVLTLAVPEGFEGRVCAEPPCRAGPAPSLDRVGQAFARVRDAGPEAANLSTGVVVLGDRACPLAGALAPGEAVHVRAEAAGGRSSNATGGPACAEDAPGIDAAAGRLWHRGRVVDEAPDPPGWGDAVRGPDGAWAPWRLPRGVEPAPVAERPVEGALTAFATRERGLERVLQVVEGARERLTVTSYLFTHGRVAGAIADAAERGVDVAVVLEPTPVGGRPDATEALVERLREAGATVRWFGGPIHDHGLQHAKVLVADGHVLLVLTENLTHSGLPADGEGNLGLGVGVANASLARRVEALFDRESPSRAWTPEGWAPARANASLVTAPENAWRRTGVPAWVRSAGRVDGLALRVSPDWGARSNAWLDALVDASREDPVRVLASGHPEGAREDNRVGLAALAGHPRRGEIAARLADPSLGTVHAKALIAGDAALVGSSNWGLGGALLNREVNLLVEHPRVADALGRVFDRAWNGTGGDAGALPRPAPATGAGPLAAAVLAATLARAASRRARRAS